MLNNEDIINCLASFACKTDKMQCSIVAFTDTSSRDDFDKKIEEELEEHEKSYSFAQLEVYLREW